MRKSGERVENEMRKKGDRDERDMRKGGEREVFNGEYLFTEPALNRPEKSGFQTGDQEKLH